MADQEAETEATPAAEEGANPEAPPAPEERPAPIAIMTLILERDMTVSIKGCPVEHETLFETFLLGARVTRDNVLQRMAMEAQAQAGPRIVPVGVVPGPGFRGHNGGTVPRRHR